MRAAGLHPLGPNCPSLFGQPDRRPRQTARPLAEHGPHMPVPDLLRLLAAGCPKLHGHSITDRCDVHCPDLPGLFAVPATGPQLAVACRAPVAQVPDRLKDGDQ